MGDAGIFAGTKTTGIFLSTEYGNAWSQVGDDLAYSGVISLVGYGSELFAVTDAQTVFYSPDNGTTWDSLNAGLQAVRITSFAVGDIFLILGTTGSGVWRSRLPIG